jgi:hypothetical protein
LDRKLPWTEFASPYAAIFRNVDGSASELVGCTKGAADNIIVLAKDPWVSTVDGRWEISQAEELTQCAWGSSTKAVKDFVLDALAPRADTRVGVSGVFYDPACFTGTMTFLANPVP